MCNLDSTKSINCYDKDYFTKIEIVFYTDNDFSILNRKESINSISELSILSHEPGSLTDYIDKIQDNFYKKYKVFPFLLFDFHAKRIQNVFKIYLKNKN